MVENEEKEFEVEEEPSTEVEVPEQENDSVEASDNTNDSDDQFKKAESATQKRIDRLTKKMREAERREQEAINYARNVQTEAEQLKQRMNNLDSSYVSEFSTRVTAQMDQAENELSRAMELGDTKAAVEAQRKITALAIQADRAEQAKSEQARYAQQAQQYAEYQKEHVQQPAQPKRPDPKAEKWALKNSWFGDDQAMTYAVFGIHKKLIEQEGFDPQSDEYYTELDRRMADEFPHKLKSQSKRPAQTVASASRTATTGRSGKKVRLTPSQVAIAKKLGVPLEEYAKYVKE
jgi:DNA repair exonuclease SbcCD ATPase subunit